MGEVAEKITVLEAENVLPRREPKVVCLGEDRFEMHLPLGHVVEYSGKEWGQLIIDWLLDLSRNEPHALLTLDESLQLGWQVANDERAELALVPEPVVLTHVPALMWGTYGDLACVDLEVVEHVL